MNKTIKKKKITKNKTQKKRVQRGGDNQKEIDKISPLIIKYINYNTDDPRIEKDRLENIKELERKIKNIDDMIETQTDKTTRHLKDNEYFKQFDINKEGEQKKTLILQKKDLMKKWKPIKLK